MLKLVFENLSSKPFLVSNRKIESAEAELKVAGREIAYLHQIRQRFSKKIRSIIYQESKTKVFAENNKSGISHN